MTEPHRIVGRFDLLAHLVAGTGHRPDKLGGYGEVSRTRDRIKVRVRDRLVWTRDAHADLVVVSGMALGFDQWLAEVAVELSIPLVAAVPFEGQQRKWPAGAQAYYEWLLARAVAVVTVCPGGYAPQKMQRRNEWMVEVARSMIVAWDGSSGGTANCVRYARSVGRPIDNVLG